MDNLTKKDKMLLYLLAVIVLVFVFAKLLVMPLYASNQALADQITEQGGYMTEMESTIGNYGGLSQQISSSRSSFMADVAKYHENLENEDIDKLITGIMVEYGLVPKNMTIEGAGNKVIDGYINSELLKEKKAVAEIKAETATQLGATPTPNTEAAPNKVVLQTGKCVVECTGTMDQLLSLLDRFGADSGIMVDEMSVTEDRRHPGSYNIELTLKIYMYDENNNGIVEAK